MAKILKGRKALPRSVMIVDDDEAMRKLIRHVVESGGYEAHVMEAGDGLDALNQICQRRVDLLITDVLMPGVDGTSLVQSLKNLKDGMTPRSILVVSSKVKQASESKVGNELTITFLPKPLDLELLKSYLVAALGEDSRRAGAQ